MSRRARTAGRVGAFLALAVLLTGCIKLNVDLGINADDTVNGAVVLGVQKELLELTGQSAEDLLGDADLIPTGATGVVVEPFEDDEFVGQQIIFEDLPISEFNSGALGASGATGISGVTGAGGDNLNITREGDTFVVTGALDLSSGLSGATGPFAGTGGAQLFENADIQISITFPGEVVRANGEVDGNTVTYVPEFGERLEINATGSAIDNGQAADVVGDSDSFLPLLLIVAGVAVVLLVIIFLVVRSRSNKDGGAGTSTGLGEPAPVATPVAPPQPGAPPAAPPAPQMPPAPPPPAEG
jgi:LppM domain